jgi:hypothetical protein
MDYLTDAQEIAVRIDDGELPETPWFVLQPVHAWNA